MQRLVKWAIVPVIVIGAALFLSSRVSEQPLTRHEKAVTIDALAK